MATARDIISASLKLIGAIAPGEAPTAAEAVDGLASLNRMIDSWSNEDLLIYAITRDEFTLTPNQQRYTYGTGGNFNATRPMEIQEVRLRVDISTPSIEYPVRILTLEEWAAIYQKDMTSTIPYAIFAEGTYPLDAINVYPVPSTAYKLVFFTLKPISNIDTLDTVLSLPKGYEEAIVYNYAMRAAPEYGRQTPQEVAMIGVQSKGNLKRTNYRTELLRVDDALIGNSTFNIYTGEYNR